MRRGWPCHSPLDSTHKRIGDSKDSLLGQDERFKRNYRERRFFLTVPVALATEGGMCATNQLSHAASHSVLNLALLSAESLCPSIRSTVAYGVRSTLGPTGVAVEAAITLAMAAKLAGMARIFA